MGIHPLCPGTRQHDEGVDLKDELEHGNPHHMVSSFLMITFLWDWFSLILESSVENNYEIIEWIKYQVLSSELISPRTNLNSHLLFAKSSCWNCTKVEIMSSLEMKNTIQKNSVIYPKSHIRSSRARLPEHFSPNYPDLRRCKRQPGDNRCTFWKVNGKLFDLEFFTMFL